METRNHVRIKPYKPEAGQVMRDYSAPWGFTYKVGIWYVEAPELAAERCAYLATVRMNSMDPYSPKAFNICTRAEAEQIKLYEESGELEQVIAASKPAIPPAPTTPGGAAPSEDLNLPAPKSELAAAAAALASAREAARATPDELPPPKPAAKTSPKKRASTRSKTRRAKPGKR